MTRATTTRRSFIKLAANAIAVGVGAPCLVSGAEGKRRKAKEQPQEEAATEKLGVGCIGVGGRGSSIGHDAGGRGNMLACADVDRQHAETFASKYGGQCEIYTDYRKLLDRHDIDIVTIGTPDHWHAKIAIEAMQAGKDVYCEKPLTLTIDEGKKICQAVRETKRVFQVGTQQRSDARFLLAIAIARSGRLGKTLKATCSIGGAPKGGPFQPATVPEGLNWDVWLGQCPEVPYTRERCHSTFRWWLEYSGGKLTDWGAHHVDIATWGLGHEASGPIEIEGAGTFPNIPNDFDPVAFFSGQAKLANGYNTATQFGIDLRYADGSLMHVQHGPDNGIWFEGDQGRIFVNRSKITGEPVEKLTAAEQAKYEEDIAKLYKGKPRKGHMQNFLDCVKDRGEPVSDVFSHHRELSSCHLCNIAMLLKRKLRWDPEKEDFIADAQASALLARPQRPAYAVKV